MADRCQNVSIKWSLACHVCISRASWYFPHAPRGTCFADDTWEVLLRYVAEVLCRHPAAGIVERSPVSMPAPQRLVHQLTANSSQHGNLKEIHTYSTSEPNPKEVVTSLRHHRTGAERLNDDEMAPVSTGGVEFSLNKRKW